MKLVLTSITLVLIGIIAIAGFTMKNEDMNKNPEKIALTFIESAPTFSYDGIQSTLRVNSFVTLGGNPQQYLVMIEFDCLHSGYGNREGMIILQVITHHTAVVRVVDGVIIEAVIDGTWDELKQEFIEKKAAASAVEDIAVSWLMSAPTFNFDGVPESIKVIDSWQAMTFVAPSFWGVSVEFDCLHMGYGDRTGQILAQAITNHVITIHVAEGKVTLAHIDDKWDEIMQKQLTP